MQIFIQMSVKDKLIERFKKQPKDFTFDELKIIIDIHKPHTHGSPMKETALKEIYNSLLNNNLIK